MNEKNKNQKMKKNNQKIEKEKAETRKIDNKIEKSKIQRENKEKERKFEKDSLKTAKKEPTKKESDFNQEKKPDKEIEKAIIEREKFEKKDENEKEVKQKLKKEKKQRKKKNIAITKAYNLRISTKHSKAICSFIKNKKIDEAIKDLEQVINLKKPVPMKGEIPHRKGKIMSGRFPKKAAQNFIKLLKNLSANASYNEIENPIIVEAIANIGSRPYGRFGRIRKKRTHIKILARDKESEKK